MYSILLKVTTSSSDRWKYLYNDDGSLYQDDDLGRVRQKVIELLSDHVLSAIKVVANKRAVSHIVIEGNPDEPGQWLPEVTIADNGKVLMVIDGEWDKGEIEVGNVLPDVTVDDNGKVLKVVEGEWAAAEESGGTDENVKQVVSNSGDARYSILFANSSEGTGTETASVRKSNALELNPENGILRLHKAYNEGGGLYITHYLDIISPKSGRNADIQLYMDTWDGSNESLRSALAKSSTTVKQNETSDIDNNFELLFGAIGDSTTRTEETRKTQYAKVNPGKKAFTFGTRLNGSTVGEYSHAEGFNVTASGSSAHAEGSNTTASNNESHAEGMNTVASGYYSHAEGSDTTASSYSAHAEGEDTTASRIGSHAEGGDTVASGDYSHAEGSGTIANHACQHVFGEYNIADTSISEPSMRGNYIEIVGNGAEDNERDNARTLDWDGNEWLAGNLTTADVIKKTGTWDGTNANLSLVITSLINRINALETQLANVNVISNQTIDEICI